MVFEPALEQTRQRYGLCVLGYVVLPEHGHLLLSEPFWQARYYDFNVWTAKKETEKLKYLYRNPVTRGLVSRPEDWAWGSYRHYASGAKGVVEMESRWTARGREGIRLSRPSKAWTGHPVHGGGSAV
jgi:putative transposase